MKKSYYLLFIAIAVLIVLLSYLLTKSIISNSKKETVETTSDKTIMQNTQKNVVPNGKAGIVSHKYTGYGIIEVIVKNNTGKELKQIRIKAHCYDKNGNNLGDSTGFENNINTTDTYKIKIYVGSDVSRYKLEVEY